MNCFLFVSIPVCRHGHCFNISTNSIISAAFVSLRSIIIVELLGIEKLTNSFGVVVLCQGLSTFIGTPIAGNAYHIDNLLASQTHRIYSKSLWCNAALCSTLMSFTEAFERDNYSNCH